MTPYTHPDLARLLAGILADPGDDGPRLAWADRLAELGDGDKAAQERAEFVRVQVELARLQGRTDSLGRRIGYRNARRIAPLLGREGELFAAHGARASAWFGLPAAWGTTLVETPGDGTSYPYGLVHRGFVEALTMPAFALDFLDKFRAQQPITRVTLTTGPGRPHHREILEGPGHDWEPAWILPTLMLVPLRERQAAVNLYLRNRWPGIAWTLPPG